MKKNVKWPRPMGSTIQAINLKKHEKEDNYKKLKQEYIRYIIKQYINQGFQINNHPTTLDELAQYLELPIKILVRYMSNMKGVFFDVEDRNQMKEGVGILVQKVLESTIRDRYLIEENTRELEKALIGPDGSRLPYKAFVSSTYNQALGLNLESQKKLIDALTMMGKLANIGSNGPTGPTIQINNNQAQLNQPTNQNLLTTEAAISMLAENKNQLLLAPGMDEVLEVEYLDGVPDLNPNTQKGYNSDKAMVGIQGSKRVKALDHEDRREGNGEIVSL